MPDDEVNNREGAKVLPPNLLKPPDPIDSCSFTIEVDADTPVIVEIYDDKGRQITRGCDGGKPGPVGTLTPTWDPATRTYKVDVCLCGIPDGSKIRIVVCTISLPGECVSFTRTVNHGGACPDCAESAKGVEMVVNELRNVVTERVAQALKNVIEAIEPEKPTKEKRGRKGKAQTAKKPGRKRGRRRRG